MEADVGWRGYLLRYLLSARRQARIRRAMHQNAVLELGAADQSAAESELVGIVEVAADR